MSISTIIENFGEYVYEFYLDPKNAEFYHAIIISKLHDQNVGSLRFDRFNNIPVGHFDVSDNGSNFIALKLHPETCPRYYRYNLTVVGGRIRAHEKDTRSAFPNKTFARFSALGHFREVEYLTCKLSGPRLTRSDVIDTVKENLKTPAYKDVKETTITVFNNLNTPRCTFVVVVLFKEKTGEIYSKIGVVDSNAILRWICYGTPCTSSCTDGLEDGVREKNIDDFRISYNENTRVVTTVQEGQENINLKFDEFYSSMVLQNNTDEPTTSLVQPLVESGSQPTITDKPQLEKQLEIKLKNNGVALEELLTVRHTELTEEILQLQKKIEEEQKVLKSMKTVLQDIQALQQSLQQTRQINQS